MEIKTRSMSWYEWLSLLMLSVLWGGSFFFVGVAVEALPPLTIVALRVCLAAIVLLAVVYLSGLAMPKRLSVWIAFAGMGLMNNVIPFSLIVWGQTNIASGLASILNATTPLFAVIAAHFFTRDEKFTKSRLLGVCIGFTGVLLMVGHEALRGIGGRDFFPQLAVLGAAFSYSIAGIFGRRFHRMGVKPLVTASGQVTASTVFLIPLALLVEHPWTLSLPGWNVWGAILGLGVLSTALAYVLYFQILSTAGATNVLLVTLLIPVSAILLGSLVLGEHLELKHFIGMGLISLGLFAIDGRLFASVQKAFMGSSVKAAGCEGE